MIYVYCSRDSISARALARALDGRRIRRIQPFAPGDLLVNWGEALQSEVRSLNSACGRNKVTELARLQEAGVAVPLFTRSRPLDENGWLARAASHHEGNDLQRPPAVPAMWTRYENLTHEFRVHVFKRGDEFVSIRLGAKFPRPGVYAHPWIRSWSAGWHILYNRDAQVLSEQTRGIRQAAKSAIQALGLEFGAVDIGVKARDGSPLVLEVNSAPGLEGRTLEVYAEEIRRYA